MSDTKFIKNSHQLGRTEIIFIIFILIALASVAIFAWRVNSNKQSSITNFDECAAAGNPIMLSYPEQCSANGQTFTKDISTSPVQPLTGNSLEKFQIPEFGVQFDLSPNLAGLYYYINPETPNVAYLSIDEFKGTDCAADKVSLMAISKSTKAEADESQSIGFTNSEYKVVGDGYYLLENAQAACSEDQAIMQKAQTVNEALINSFNTSLIAIE